MRHLGYFALALLLTSLGLLHLATAQPPAAGKQSTPPQPKAEAKKKAEPPPPPKEDPAAAKTVAQAADLHDLAKNPGWVETRVWQQFDLKGLSYQTQGHYRAGPGYKLRLEMSVRLAGTTADNLVVCDGTTVWQKAWTGTEKPTLTRWNVKRVLDKLNEPGMLPQMREDFFQGQAFMGLTPLLRNLRQQLTFTKQEEATWKEQKVLKVTGVWNAELTKGMVAAENWPAYLPRTCTLYFNPKTLWLVRMEWRGPSPPKTQDALLIQTEFRDHQGAPGSSPAPALFANAFTFDPGKGEVIDLTETIVKEVAAMGQQRAAMPKPPGGAR